MGSVLFALLVARHYGVDLRAKGSGNPGASNVARVLGKGPGLLVLALDGLKGFLVTLAAMRVLHEEGVALAGAAVVVGHCYPLFHRFRGGKGAATAAGVILALAPIAGGAALVTYLCLRGLTKKASLGSLGGVLVALGIISYEGVREARWVTLGLAVFLTTLIAWRHRSNIERLRRGEERDA